mmetsp:Transcript_27859/g.41470  ORF Transcript_27859/g.41470 Transcript_27859/m.41470 type:complete len:496 (-) Transcript_27859:95-1582(-)
MTTASEEISSRRWIILALMCALNLFVDFVAFSASPQSSIFTEVYNVDVSNLVSVFLAGNVCMSLFVAAVLQRFGLRSSLAVGAGILFVGNLMKSGIPFLLENTTAWLFYPAYLFCGASQPFFQISILEVAIQWFPQNEKNMAIGSMATSGGMGVALAYLLTSLLVQEDNDCAGFLSGITVTSLALLVAVVVIFTDGPNHKGGPAAKPVGGGGAAAFGALLRADLRAARGALRSFPFLALLLQAAFAEGFTDAVGTYIDEIYSGLAYSQLRVALVACFFFLLVLASAFCCGLAVARVPAAKRAPRALAGLVNAQTGLAVLICLLYSALQGIPSLYGMDLYLLLAAAFAGPVKALGLDLAAQSQEKSGASYNTFQICQLEMFVTNLWSLIMLKAFSLFEIDSVGDDFTYSFLFLAAVSTCMVFFVVGVYQSVLKVLLLEDEGALSGHGDEEAATAPLQGGEEGGGERPSALSWNGQDGEPELAGIGSFSHTAFNLAI